MISTEKIPKLTEPIFNDWYLDGLMEIVIYWAALPYWQEALIRFTSLRTIFHEVYRGMVARKELKPIEELSKDEKLRIWKLTEGLEERIKASRAIYLLETILNKTPTHL